MVEPVSLTLGAIVAGLVAKAAERATEDVVEGGEGVLRRLVAALRERFSSADEAAGDALTRVQEVPDSPSRVRALATVIDERAKGDAELRGELEELVEQARGAGVDVESISQVALGNQNVQAAGLVDSEVNVSYGSPPPARPGP